MDGPVDSGSIKEVSCCCVVLNPQDKDLAGLCVTCCVDSVLNRYWETTEGRVLHQALRTCTRLYFFSFLRHLATSPATQWPSNSPHIHVSLPKLYTPFLLRCHWLKFSQWPLLAARENRKFSLSFSQIRSTTDEEGGHRYQGGGCLEISPTHPLKSTHSTKSRIGNT